MCRGEFLFMKICPRCKRNYKERSALSRIDNKTEICSICGTYEALEAYSNFCTRYVNKESENSTENIGYNVLEKTIK